MPLFDPNKQEDIEALLARPLLAHVGTANPVTGQPHITLVWFLWDGEALWISGFASSRKFREMRANPRVAILIEPADPKDSKLQAVLFEGAIELFQEPRSLVEEMSHRIYVRYLGEAGVLAADPQSWIHDPENRAARLKPSRVYTW